jgi:hypothetical protein
LEEELGQTLSILLVQVRKVRRVFKEHRDPLVYKALRVLVEHLFESLDQFLMSM